MLPTIVPAVSRPVTALHGRPGDEPRSTIVTPSEAKAWTFSSLGTSVEKPATKPLLSMVCPRLYLPPRVPRSAIAPPAGFHTNARAVKTGANTYDCPVTRPCRPSVDGR